MIDRFIKAGCRCLLGLGTVLAVAAVYSPASGVTAGAFIVMIDMWVSDIVTALKERSK